MPTSVPAGTLARLRPRLAKLPLEALLELALAGCSADAAARCRSMTLAANFARTGKALLASRTTSSPLPLGFLQPTNEVSEHWKREREAQAVPIRLHQAACRCCVRLALTGGRQDAGRNFRARAGWSRSVMESALKRVTRETGLRLRSRRQGVAMSRADGR